MFALFDQKLILETTILHNVCEQWSRQKNSTNWKASIPELTRCVFFMYQTKSSFYVDIQHLHSSYLQLIKCLSNIYNLMHLTILCLCLATCVALPNICESFLYHQNKQKFFSRNKNYWRKSFWSFPSPQIFTHFHILNITIHCWPFRWPNIVKTLFF